MTLREIALVFEGDRQRRENDQAMAYYQAYMSGVFSQPYAKGKFPKFEANAPWRKVSGRANNPNYDKQLERMMMMFTAAQGGQVH